MGDFMAKKLGIRDLRDYCLATHREAKPLNLDEDNAASQYKDVEGWTIHRKRAWTTLLCGCHYDYIDFSIVNYMETGTPDSQRYIRSWMKYLSEFIHSIDLVRARPVAGLLKSQLGHVIESVLAVDNEDYCIYLADERELDEEGCGSLINGAISLDLPDRSFQVSYYSPERGLYSPSVTVSGGRDIMIELPGFNHDLVLRLKSIPS